METTQINIKTEAAHLAADSFAAFCSDIEGMFGVEIKCVQSGHTAENAEVFKKRLKKLCAVNTVRAKGTLCGDFYLLFGSDAIFTLGGIFVMQPKNKILENIKFGTEQNAAAISDAVKEAGNLLVGSWDRIFREELDAEQHLLQKNFFIGQPQQQAEGNILLPNDAMLDVYSYQITAAEYPSFDCFAVFPEVIYSQAAAEKPDELQQQAEAVVENPKQEQVKIFPILDLKAIDIMNNQIQWCSPADTVEAAIAKMQTCRVDYLLVGSDQKAQGIVAMSDLKSALSIYLKPMFAKWKTHLDEATLMIKVQAIMSCPVRTITSDTALDIAAEKILQLGGCLVVVDKESKPIGLITNKDFVKKLLQSK